MSVEAKRGWLADYTFTGGKFESGLAMFVGPDGRITQFSKEPNDLQQAIPLRGRALIPGLVNGHSHTFQRIIRGRTEFRTNAHKDTFWTWREKMYHAATVLSPDDLYIVARMAFLEMALSGITTVGEFHYLHHQADGTRYDDVNLLGKTVIQAARDIGLRIKLLRAAYQRAGFKHVLNPSQVRFITPTADEFIADTESLADWVKEKASPDEVGIGLAPHSLRAVPLDYLRAIAIYAAEKDIILHMHVAEQPSEIAACRAEYQRSPVELLESEGILSQKFTAVHAIHITVAEANMLKRSFVCACPTSERNLGDGAVPANELALARMSLGSDSQIQIDLLEDARLVEYHLRMNRLERIVLEKTNSSCEILAQTLFQMSTVAGARSLRMPVGELAVGKPADFFTVDLSDPSIAGAGKEALLSNILFSLERSAIRDLFVAGKSVVTGRVHPLQEKVVGEFNELQERLWRSKD